MPFLFTCPYCFKKTLVDESLAGQSGPCSACGKTITVPGEASTAPSAGVSSTDTLRPNATNSKQLAWVLKIVGFIVVAGILFSLSMFLFWPVFQGLKIRRNKIANQSNLQQVAKGLNAYAAQYGTYPPATVFDSAGKPMHSWRVLILPFIGEESLYASYNFEQSWDSTENAKVLARCPEIFRSPGATENTCFLITGPGTLFPKSRPLGPSDISDGPEKTLLVVESDNPLNEWTKPLDIDIQALNPTIGATGNNTLGGNHLDGAAAVFADGSPAWLDENLNPVLLRAAISPRGGEPIKPTDFQMR